MRHAKSDAVGAARTDTREGGISYPRIPYPQINPRLVVDVFLEAVDRGELIVFKKRISRSMLEPERVEYIYALDDHAPTVKVFSALKKPFPFPDMPEVLVEGITGALDWNGHITESTVHCQ
ncbi:MAG TPA: hypothetical protein VEI74_05715 [Candidatus Methylomirabilis sp.]|nr:hypothetical protein [Candidatus Methylomirabilis sp.]